jgi:hypothetical protein
MESKEYEKRKQFLDTLKKLHASEYGDIVRILKQENVAYSENTNGIFFDVSKIPQKAFNALEKFMNFVNMNRKELADREKIINKMSSSSK